MGKTCVVTWCGSSYKRTPEKAFFGFPKREKNREDHSKWKCLLGLSCEVGNNAVVCSDHFLPEDIEVAVRPRLRNGAMPKELGN